MPKRIFDRWRQYLEDYDLADFDSYIQFADRESLFTQMLLKVAEYPELLRHHHRDLLVHDRRVLYDAMPGEEYVWLIRDMGTELAKVGDPLQAVTYWIPRHPAYVQTRVFLLKVTGSLNNVAYGTIEPISYARAYELLQPDG